MSFTSFRFFGSGRPTSPGVVAQPVGTLSALPVPVPLLVPSFRTPQPIATVSVPLPRLAPTGPTPLVAPPVPATTAPALPMTILPPLAATPAPLVTLFSSFAVTPILGTAGADRRQGTTGADSIAGLGGNDTLSGGVGADTLDGGSGADSLDGGVGNDLLLGGDGADTLSGGTDEDRLLGGTGDDLLLGGTGNDTLEGGEGADTLDGGLGADRLVGGGGNDLYIVNSASDAIVELADGGADTVQASVSWVLGDHLEALVLTGTQNLSGTGNSLNNLLVGNAGRNLLSGLGGDDVLQGGAGADTLDGGAGNDRFVYVSRGDTATDPADLAGMDVIRGLEATDSLDLRGLRGLDAGSFNIVAHDSGDGTANDYILSWTSTVDGVSRTNYVLLVDAGQPVITLQSPGGNTAVSGRLVEDAAQISLGGTLATADGAPGGFTMPASLAGTYGDFTFDTETGAWGYTLASARPAVQALAAGQTASDTLAVQASDGAAWTLTMHVSGMNDAPEAIGSLVATNAGLAASGFLTAVDVDKNDILTFALEEAPSKGVVAIAADGSFTYTPDDGASGADGFLFRVTDASGASATASVDVQIAVAEAPPLPPGFSQIFSDPEPVVVAASPARLTTSPFRKDLPDFAGGNSIAALAVGGFVVTWSSLDQDGSGWGVYAQRYAADGTAIESEFLVNSTISNNQIYPAVAALSDGGFVVTWTSFGQDGSAEDIYARRYAADGTTIGSEFLVNTVTLGDQNSPGVAALEGGGFVVTWASVDEDGSNRGIYAQRYAADGTAIGSEFLVNTVTSDFQSSPAVAALEGGGFVVTWTSLFQDGWGWGIYARRYAADGTAIGSEFLVNTVTSGDQNWPAVATLSGGGFVVTWTSFGQDGSDGGIYAQRYDADGKAVGVEVQVNSTISNNQIYPAVAALSDGGFVVTWTSVDQDGLGSGIYAQRYAADGAVVGPEFRLSENRAGDQNAPDVVQLRDGPLALVYEDNKQIATRVTVDAADELAVLRPEPEALPYAVSAVTITTSAFVKYLPGFTGANIVAALSDGGFVVTWTSFGQDGSGGDIYAQRYAADGTTIGSEFLVNTVTLGDQNSPGVAALEGGGFVVTWASVDEDGSNRGIYAQRYAADGTAIGSEFLVNTVTSDFQSSPAVAALEGGGFVVTWTSFGQDGSGGDIYARRYAADGTAIGSEFLVNTVTSDFQSSPAVAALEGGGFVVTWTSFGQDGSGLDLGIYAQQYAADGTTIGSEFLVNTVTSGDQNWPAVAALSGGGFVVTWASYLQDSSGWGIYAQRYDADGKAVGVEVQVNTFTWRDQLYPAVAALSDGGFVVTWSSLGQDGSGLGIYAQRYAADGTVVGPEFRLSENRAGDQNAPDAVQLKDGSFAVVYADNEQIATRLVIEMPDGSTVGAKTLIGTPGNDVLIGSPLSDALEGAAGADVLTGGAGADTLRFVQASDSTIAAPDRITDFSAADGDVIDMSAIDADPIAEGDQAFAFIAAVAFTPGQTGQLRYDALPADQYRIEADIDGDGTAEMAILVTSVTAPQTEWFIL